MLEAQKKFLQAQGPPATTFFHLANNSPPIIACQEAKTPSAPTSSKASGNKRGGGGAWRAFVHMASKHQRFTASDMGRLSEEYWALSQEDYNHLKSMGDQACKAHSAGLGSFPALSRRTRQHRPEAHADREAKLQTQHDSERLSTELRDLILTGEGVSPEFLAKGNMDFYLKGLSTHATRTKLEHAKKQAGTEKGSEDHSGE